MTAVEFSPQERARLEAIEAAQPAPESWFIRKLIAAELRAAADEAHDEYSGWEAANVVRARAAVLDPTS